MHDHINTKTRETRWKKYKGWLILVVTLTILGSVLWYNKPLLTAYYLNARYNDFKPGDKIYAHAYLLTDTGLKSFTIHFLHKLRPLTEDDVDKMDADLLKKALIKQALRSSDRPYVAESAWGLSNDSLCKYKTAFLGTYMKSEIANIKYKGKYIPVVLFAIKPFKKAINKDEIGDMYKIPDNYKEDEESPVYISADEADKKEVKTFRKVN